MCVSSATIWASIFSGDSLDSPHRCAPSLNSQNLPLFSFSFSIAWFSFFVYEEEDSTKKRARTKNLKMLAWYALAAILWQALKTGSTIRICACTNCSTATCVFYTRLFYRWSHTTCSIAMFLLFPIKIFRSFLGLSFFSNAISFWKTILFDSIIFFLILLFISFNAGNIEKKNLFWNWRMCW